MPWSVGKSDSCPASKPWAVITKDSGKTHGCFPSRAAAMKQMAVLYVKQKKGEIAELELPEITPELWAEMMQAVVDDA